MRWNEHEKNYTLRFDNGISVEILKEGSRYGGLGRVKYGRRKLRCEELPVMPMINTPNGFEVCRLEFEDIQKDDQSVTLRLRPFMVPRGRMEWLCCDGEDRWHVGTWEDEPDRDRGGMLEMTLRGVSRTIGDMTFDGFAYSYAFHSRKYYAFRIHDRATWELGGSATGNSFWMAGPFNEPRKTLQNKDDSFTTAWCHREDELVQLQQFLPLFTSLQGFSFQFDRHSILVTAFEEPFHCRSLFQKESGRNYLVHWHQLCGDLGGSLRFPAIQVLCAASETDSETERANQYRAVRSQMEQQCRRKTDVVFSRVRVTGCLDGINGNNKGIRRGLDELTGTGCERVYLPKLMRALAPDNDSPTARGEAERMVQDVIENVHARGLEAALSLDDCCCAWLVKGSETEETGPIGLAGADLVAAALRGEEKWQFLLAHMRRLKSEFDVDALVAEDLLEGLTDQFDWSGSPGRGRVARSPADIRSLQERRLALTAELQQMGYRCPTQGIGELATPGAECRIRFPKGAEFMFPDFVMPFPAERFVETEKDPFVTCFRACANRISFMPTYHLDRGTWGELDEWWEKRFAALNRAYQAVREHMGECCILPEDRGILWHGRDPEVRVLWSYKKSKRTADSRAEVFDVMDGRSLPVEEGNFNALAHRVYLIQQPPSGSRRKSN